MLDFQLDYAAIASARADLGEELALGVVRSTKVVMHPPVTHVSLEAGEAMTYSLTVKHNAGFLLSKLCVLNEKAKTVYALQSPSLKFAVMAIQRREMVECEHCGRLVGAHRMQRHMRKAHSSLSPS